MACIHPDYVTLAGHDHYYGWSGVPCNSNVATIAQNGGQLPAFVEAHSGVTGAPLPRRGQNACGPNRGTVGNPCTSGPVRPGVGLLWDESFPARSQSAELAYRRCRASASIYVALNPHFAVTEPARISGEQPSSARGSVCVEGEARFIEEDFVNSFLAVQKWSHRAFMFAGCVALALVSVMLLNKAPWLAGFAGAVGAVFGLSGLWQSAGPRVLARQHLRAIHEDELPVRFRFDESGMTVSGSWGTSFYRYGGMHDFTDLRSTILVQTGPVLRMVVPKRAFSADDRKIVLELLRTRVTRRPHSSGEPSRALVWRAIVLWIGILLLLLIAAGVIDFGASP
jgi:hypothetical protein